MENEQATSVWEKTLEDEAWRFTTGRVFRDYLDLDKLKSFISRLLATERERLATAVEGMKPILWNDDPNELRRNIARYETLDEVLSLIRNEDYDEVPYSQEDHEHCWEVQDPPCGQKIEHLKCCLCELVNPKAAELISN